MLEETTRPVKLMLAFDASSAVQEALDFANRVNAHARENNFEKKSQDEVNDLVLDFFVANKEQATKAAEACRNTKITEHAKNENPSAKVKEIIVEKAKDQKHKIMMTYGNMLDKYNATDDLFQQAMAIVFFFPVFSEFLNEYKT